MPERYGPVHIALRPSRASCYQKHRSSRYTFNHAWLPRTDILLWCDRHRFCELHLTSRQSIATNVNYVFSWDPVSAIRIARKQKFLSRAYFWFNFTVYCVHLGDDKDARCQRSSRTLAFAQYKREMSSAWIHGKACRLWDARNLITNASILDSRGSAEGIQVVRKSHRCSRRHLFSPRTCRNGVIIRLDVISDK
jgi:hypothetical protein